MSELVNVAVDAMGGDNAPTEIVKGAIEAVKESGKVKVFLVGKENLIKEELKKYQYDEKQVEVVHAGEVIETAEPPVMAIRKKKDSSIVKALYLVKTASATLCVGRKHRRNAGRRPSDRRKDQRSGKASSCTVDPYGKRSFSFNRLRRQCGCQTVPSGTVCQDGFRLYGKRHGRKKSESSDRKYRCGGRKRKRPCKRNFSALKILP